MMTFKKSLGGLVAAFAVLAGATAAMADEMPLEYSCEKNGVTYTFNGSNGFEYDNPGVAGHPVSYLFITSDDLDHVFGGYQLSPQGWRDFNDGSDYKIGNVKIRGIDAVLVLDTEESGSTIQRLVMSPANKDALLSAVFGNGQCTAKPNFG